MSENVSRGTEEGDVLKNVPRETVAELKNYVALLTKWNERINLISDSRDIWQRHILDSAQIFSLLPSPDITIADLGSGGGLPGVVLSIMGVREVHLIESDQRKCVFLKEAIRNFKLNATVHDKRIEASSDLKADVITSRALASLDELLAYAKPFMKEDAICLFPKGKNYLIEIEEARKHWTFDLDVYPSRTHSEGVILRIRNLNR